MKHLLYTISAVGLTLLNTPATAQDNNTYKGDITISPLELRQKGDSLICSVGLQNKWNQRQFAPQRGFCTIAGQ